MYSYVSALNQILIDCDWSEEICVLTGKLLKIVMRYWLIPVYLYLAILYGFMFHYPPLLFIQPFSYSPVLLKNAMKHHAAPNLNGISEEYDKD